MLAGQKDLNKIQSVFQEALYREKKIRQIKGVRVKPFPSLRGIPHMHISVSSGRVRWVKESADSAAYLSRPRLTSFTHSFQSAAMLQRLFPYSRLQQRIAEQLWSPRVMINGTSRVLAPTCYRQPQFATLYVLNPPAS